MMKNIKFALTLFLFALSFLGNAQTEEPQLIYVMDPQCSWCYSNSGNIEEIENALEGKMDIKLQVGGMWLGDDAPQGGASYFEFVNGHFPGMLGKTGAYVSPAYYDLAADTSYSFSSLEPCAAIVAIDNLYPAKTITFAKGVERALFAEGKRLDKKETYLEVLKMMHLPTADFEKTWLSDENLAETRAEFASSKIAKTFPSLLLKTGNKVEVLGTGFFTKEQILPKIEAAIAQ
ncbi:DsbA family protein [Leeuwenhoekiella sp. A16]|uniref:DsbA family protein n=1 Tax=unclassified Leeuwenhoekiella TaxID=2615029 RepID=UPI003A8059F0